MRTFILTRSPYYYNVPFANDFVTKVRFSVSGQFLDENDQIDAQTYVLEKLRPSKDSQNTWIDLSPFLNDFYNPRPLELSQYTTATVVESRDVIVSAFSFSQVDTLGSDLPTNTEFFNHLYGYGYYMEGQNAVSKQAILLSNTNYRAYQKGYFIVPLACDENSTDPTVNGVAVALNYANNAQNYLKYLIVPINSYSQSIEIVYEGESIYIEIMEECKYKVNHLQFINRFGVLEAMTFYKASVESINTSSEDFKNAYTNGTSYRTTRHQKKQFNKVSNKKIKMETGFLNEEYNQTVQELMESEHVWLNEIPVNVSSSSLEFKTRIVDKLISYSLDFEYAFDEINNV